MLYFDRTGPTPGIKPVPTPGTKVGEIRLVMSQDMLELNKGLATAEIYPMNIGDRPIQVGSHAHLADVNPELLFFKDKATADQVAQIMLKKMVPAALISQIKPLAETPDRGGAHWGFRFDIASGASLRFDPMSAPEGPCSIVAIGGNRVVPGIRLDKAPGDENL